MGKHARYENVRKDFGGFRRASSVSIFGEHPAGVTGRAGLRYTHAP